jgi:GNAT superfamily N-acetyltransferase
VVIPLHSHSGPPTAYPSLHIAMQQPHSRRRADQHRQSEAADPARDTPAARLLRVCELDVARCHHLSDYVQLMQQGRWVTEAAAARPGVSLSVQVPPVSVLVERWAEMRQNVRVFVAETDDGRVVGAVSAVREVELMGCRWHIENVVTRRGHRRQGVARRLMQHALTAVNEAEDTQQLSQDGSKSQQLRLPDVGGGSEYGRDAHSQVSYIMLSASKHGPRRLYASCGFIPFGVQLQHALPTSQGGPPSSPGAGGHDSPISAPSLPAQLELRLVRIEDSASLFSLLQRKVELTGWSHPFLPPRCQPSSPSSRRDGTAYPRTATSYEQFHAALLSFLADEQVRRQQKQVWVVTDRQQPGGDGGRVWATGSLFVEHKLTEGGGRPTAHISQLYAEDASATATTRASLPAAATTSTAALLSELMSGLLREASRLHCHRALLRCSFSRRGLFSTMGWRPSSQQMYKPISCEASTAQQRREMAERSWMHWWTAEVLTRLLPVP